MNFQSYLDDTYSFVPETYYKYATEVAEDLMEKVLKDVNQVAPRIDMRADLDRLSGMMEVMGQHASDQHKRALGAIISSIRAIACQIQLCSDFALLDKDKVLHDLDVRPSTNAKLCSEFDGIKWLILRMDDSNEKEMVQKIVVGVRAAMLTLGEDFAISERLRLTYNIESYQAPSGKTIMMSHSPIARCSTSASLYQPSPMETLFKVQQDMTKNKEAAFPLPAGKHSVVKEVLVPVALVPSNAQPSVLLLDPSSTKEKGPATKTESSTLTMEAKVPAKRGRATKRAKKDPKPKKAGSRKSPRLNATDNGGPTVANEQLP